ncbi:MAG: RHS repeat protein, partial [Bacteroidales bacterium]|nr:RHS repeat protein [Bacteroidales bacterium]
MSLNHDSRISAIITIATGDGYVYTYGCFNDSDYIEYSYDVVNLGPGSAVNFSAIKLYSITAPNGRQVTFNYNVPANGLPYKDVSYKYKTRISQGFYSSLSNMKQDATLMMTVYSPLRGVLVDGDEIIRFNYSSKDSDEYGTNAFSSGFQNLRGSSVSHVTNNTDNKRLSSIVITSPDDDVIDNIQLSHIYSSDAGGHSPKMFLSTVNSRNGLSSFDYHNASSSSVYPPVDCDETDHWGFWRGSGGYYLFSANNIHHQDTSLYNLINQNKDPVTAYASYGALTCIHYPTGGSSEIEYEANYADKRLDINLTGNAGYFLDNEHCQAGGLRVAKIVNTSGQYGAFRDSVTFSYNDSGILSYMPRYSAEVFVSVPLSSSFIAYPITCSNGISFRSDPSNHIGYSCVSAHYSDGSHTEYEFNDYVSHPDHYLSRSDVLLILVKVLYLYDAATGNYDFSGYYAPDTASERYAASVTGLLLDNGSSIRGSLKAERNYTAEGLLIKSITQNYTNSTSCSLNTMFNCLSYCCVAPRVFHSPRLESVITTDYRSGSPVTTTTEYTYNSKGQRTEEHTSTSTIEDDYITRYRYWHEIDDTAPAGNVSDVVRSRLHGNNEYVTSLDHYTYHAVKQTLPVRKATYHFPTLSPTQTPFTPLAGTDSTWAVISYNTTNHWRPWMISYPDDAYVKYGWDATGRYVLSREENGLANKTYYQWQDMVGLSHITYPTGQGEYYGYDSRNRLCSVDNTWQEPLARYDYHLVNGGDTLTGGTNFIRRTSYLRPAISYADISYYDGLGYPVQDVALDAGSAGHVVTPKWLDPMRREDARLYLPYPSDVYTFDASAIASQQNWYQNRFGSGEVYNYQENTYGTSPAGRKESSHFPGSAFRNHSDTFVYRVNTAADSVLALSYNAATSPTISVGVAYAPAGTLACTVTTDADGHIAETFSDAFGHVVLSRSRGDGDKADTYYVRDMKDSLVCVIQPEGSALISRGTSLSLSPQTMPSALSNYAFIYTYDARGRLTARKGPSLEAEEYTYDDRDRLVTSTDGNLRDYGWKIKYEYDIYDCLTRKSIVNATTGATVAVLSEYAYDRTGYQCTGANAPPVPTALAFEVVDPGITGVYAPATTDRTGTSLGQKYYEKQLILEGGRYSYSNPKYVERAFYYDNLGRLLQSVESNAQGGITRESFNYDLAGNPVSRHISATAGNTTVTKLTAFDNDTRGRVAAEYTYLNGATTPTTSVIFTYDVLGRQNATNDGGLVQADHYGLQGWVSYRASELTAGGVTSDVFSEYLHREDPVYPSPSWTGHITEVFWMHGGQPIGTYALTYDGFGRLKDAWRYMYGQPTNAWSERGISYDKNGN